MQLNGFEIETYNVHGIPSKAKTSTCPKCSHTRQKNPKQKCLSVFWDTGLGKCNHCGAVIQLHTYKKKNQTKEYKKPVVKPKSDLSKHLVDWFGNRGISEQTLIDLKISQSKKWMPKAGKEIEVMEFNYFFMGELINIKSRGKGKDFMFESGCELIMYNLDAIVHEDTCVIVEGEPDALAFHESGVKNVCSVPNGFTLPREDGTSTISTSYLDDYYEFFENKEKVYLAFDNDAAGIEGQKEFIRRLGAEKCFIVDFKDCKDANDYLIKYGKESLANTIATAKQVPLEGVVRINDIKNELIDFWINGAPRGFTIDLPGFDEVASFIFKQYTLLAAAPGSGKSDFIDHICARLSIKYGFKTAVCSTENKPIKLHYDKIFKKIWGKRPSENQVSSNEVNQAINFIQDHYFHVDQEGRFYLDDILMKFAELVKRKGVRIFVLDPFNKIKLKDVDRNNVNAYTEEYHARLDEFCTKYDCHIFLVLHPNKLQTKEGSTKTYIMPTAYNIKGGGEHFDMSYNIIGMVRDYERSVVQIRTLKWKFQHLGTAGVDNWYGWDINNGRYTEIDGHFDETTLEQPDFNWCRKNWLHEKLSFEEKMQLKPEQPESIPMLTPDEAFGEDDKPDEVPF